MKYARTILAWTAVAVLLVFVALNFHRVSVYFGPFGEVSMPAALIVIGSALLGAGAAVGFRFLKKSPPK